jgi:hypothetical protein
MGRGVVAGQRGFTGGQKLKQGHVLDPRSEKNWRHLTDLTRDSISLGPKRRFLSFGLALSTISTL